MPETSSPFALNSKIALITGASSGLGRATAEVLAECGAHVIVNHCKQPEAAAVTAESIARNGGSASVVEADISSESAVNELFGQIQREYERLDILVNNAGITKAQDIFTTSLQDWESILAVNLTGCFLCSRGAMELMRRQKSGRIVNLSSVVAHQGSLYGPVHYAASKSGILGITKSLARTGAPLGINVNAVAPGIIETELLFRTHGEEGVDKLAAATPLGLGKPRDVGLAVAFLSCEASRYITGTTLDVNGGLYFR
jgi:3-oxoacyl-[acyl-carrier protein] reductase